MKASMLPTLLLPSNAMSILWEIYPFCAVCLSVSTSNLFHANFGYWLVGLIGRTSGCCAEETRSSKSNVGPTRVTGRVPLFTELLWHQPGSWVCTALYPVLCGIEPESYVFRQSCPIKYVHVRHAQTLWLRCHWCSMSRGKRERGARLYTPPHTRLASAVVMRCVAALLQYYWFSLTSTFVMMGPARIFGITV